ncbi:elongator complex protein 2 [Centruroides vittatus]|uniref:elongator complex protein 2 n=1 Tax=Centruroides vittatus TaxID=120091 RepID=UPI003510C0ED
MAKIENIYTSCSCNPAPHCLDWGDDDLIIFGTCNAISLYDKVCERVICTLNEHSKPVTSVRWIRCGTSGSEPKEFLSSSVDRKVLVWRKSVDKFEVVHTLTGHQNTITVADAVYWSDANNTRRLTIASASSDSTVKIWCGNENVTISQTIEIKHGFALDVRFCLLNEVPILAIGGNDTVVHLYVQNATSMFSNILSLKGHEDWIRGLDFLTTENGDALLASCSQDCFIRIWKITPVNISKEADDNLLKLKENTFILDWNGKKLRYNVNLESVSAGHEDWVYSIHWLPSKTISDAKLLSASMDKTMILWEFDEISGIWLEKIRVGEVGGNTLGFYGGVFSPNGLSILAQGYQGALHLWSFHKESGVWKPGFTISGHFKEVVDISWDPKGDYLLSCSADQTTRLHAPQKSSEKGIWCEISRPQIHGYDINCLTVINRTLFVSGADEKVIRVFQAPKNFVKNIKEICQIDISLDLISEYAEGASVPPLGLSNKAVFESDLINDVKSESKHPKDRYPDHYYTSITMQQPPSEDILLQNTLWPEIQKLYGHGYEIHTVACNHAGTIIASASKANKADHAEIILWDVKTWKQITSLHSHNLTVTQIAFSPDDNYILSVSRDRSWTLFKKISNQNMYERVAYTNKVTGIHTRIIWACSWSHDGEYFVTASRDKSIVIWEYDKNINEVTVTSKWQPCSIPFKADDSVTAIDFAPFVTPAKAYLIAIGLEKGEILLYSWKKSTKELSDWQLCAKLNCDIAHHKTVSKLKFSPKLESENTFKLASCSHDHSVKIFNIILKSNQF